jgi:2,4-dienoyl-CoA reductase-like NADH-dependent reductase (Old Yellow Enzyme family)/thioredoxin reductase
MKYPHLFGSFQVGSLKLKNRLVMSPMTMNYATPEGFATERLVRYYLERAKGGVGLIVVEGTFFTLEGKGYKNQLGLGSPAHAEKLKGLTEAVHGLKNDARIFIQIHHAGGRASSKVTGLQPVAPSALAAYPGAEVPRALTREEILGVIDAHIQAAAWAKEAGFDGVDIHCAHGYLVPSFFSPLTNRRTDEYGGDLSGRTRFLNEIVGGIKERLGRAFPVTIKISGDEFIEGGLGLQEMIQIALRAQEAGVDEVMVSAGSVGAKKIGDLTDPHKILRTLPMMTEPGCLVPLAAEMKKSLRIPVATIGRINTPSLAEEILAQGKADLIAMGRPLLADPYLPQKALEGEEDRIRPCIACNEGCYKRIFEQKDIQCSVNPVLGREGEVVSSPSPQLKKIFIVGGGPAGLEAAHVAWERGHQVFLVEREKRLGGQLNLAHVPPGRKEIERFKDFLLARLERTGVEVISGKRALIPLIKKRRPDVLVLATGAQPRSFNIPGLEKIRTVTAWEVLSGKKKPRGTCLVLGAGLVGCEMADFLSGQGKKAVLVEILPEIATGADADTKAYFGMRFKQNGVEVHAGTDLLRVEEKTAILKQGEHEKRVKVGTLIFAVGAESRDQLCEELISSGYSIKKVGDCVQPRSILEAVQEGFQAGNKI